MAMKIAEAIKAVESSKSFIEWKEHENAKLASMFTMFENEAESWTINYFSSNRITTFQVENGACSLIGEEETEKAPKQLNISEVKVEMEEAAENTKEMLNKKTGENVNRTIAILQNIEEGQIWNISLMTASLNIYNVKLDASTLEVKTESYGALFQMT